MGDSPDWTTQIAFVATPVASVNIGAGVSVNDLLVAQYNSLIFFEFAYPGGTAGPVIMQHTQAFAPSGVFAADNFYGTAELTNNNGFLVIQTPVLGNYLSLRNVHPTQSAEVVVYGLNSAALGLRRWLGYGQLPRIVTIANAGAVSGTLYGGTIVDLPAGATVPNQMAFNGLTAFSGTSSLSGTLYFYYLDPANNMVGAAIGTVTTNVPFNLVGYYEGYARLAFIPSQSGNLNCPVNITAGAPQQ